MEPVVKIQIELYPNGNIQLNGIPEGQLILVLGLLENSKLLVVDYYKKQAEKMVQPAHVLAIHPKLQ